MEKISFIALAKGDVRHSSWKWCQLHDNSYQGLALQLSSSFLFKELLYLNTSLCLSVCLFVCLSVCQSVCLSVCLTLSLSLCVCVCTSFSVLCISLYHSGLTLSLCFFSLSLFIAVPFCPLVYITLSLFHYHVMSFTLILSHTHKHTRTGSLPLFSLSVTRSLSLSLPSLPPSLTHNL